MANSAKRLAQKLTKAFPQALGELEEFRDEITIAVDTASEIASICQYAKTELGFDYLVDISSVDNYGDDPRFEVVYELYGYEHQSHLRLVAQVSEEAASLPTVTGIWRTADWHEREIYDMMGIRFEGHPDLRRILMWEGYPHYPLRKDFPLAGKPTELPEIAFTKEAPLEGGPFVTTPGAGDRVKSEPRSKS
jgi:NADH-quinone oxidoreductase subunit C